MSGYWTDKNGTDWDIEQMDDSYLINCIKYIEDRMEKQDGFLVPPVYYSLMGEYKKRIGVASRGF